jgi:hypothetical protein
MHPVGRTPKGRLVKNPAPLFCRVSPMRSLYYVSQWPNLKCHQRPAQLARLRSLRYSEAMAAPIEREFPAGGRVSKSILLATSGSCTFPGYLGYIVAQMEV